MLSVAMLIMGVATPVTASPVKSSDETEAVSFPIVAKGLSGASFTAVPAADLTDPPGGGCTYNDITGNIHAQYLDGVLVTTESEWSAKVLCTTTAPGQWMAAIQVTSTLWLNGVNIAQGATFTCSACNLGNSTGADICAGTQCAGTYWVSGAATLTLPTGWVWSTYPSECISIAAAAIRCTAVSNTVTVLVSI